MKARLFLLLLALGTSTLFAQQGNPVKPKLSAAARLYLWQQEQAGAPNISPDYVYSMDAASNVYLSTLIKVLPGFNEAPLKALGAHIGTKAGQVWTVRVPLGKFRDMTLINGIEYIETDQPTAPTLDSARKTTQVDKVHSGLALPQAYTGQDVVVGIIDAGFDYTHPTNYDTAYANYRVKRVWEEKNITGTPPSGFVYGSEYADSAAIISKAYDIYDGTHGTHVAGIAGGSGAGGTGGNNTRFRGMAYSSEMVFVAIYPTAAYWLNTGMADMLDGINYVYDYADAVSKPAVANLSWGCPLGPHDGNSLFSQACDAITGPGRIFVLSGGNNGGNNIHLKKTFTSASNKVSTVVTFPSSASLPEKRNQVDIWGDTSKTFCVRFSLYAGAIRKDSTALICLDDLTHQLYLKGTGGDTCVVTITTVSSEFNGKPHMLVQLLSKTTDRLIMSISATDGSIDAWQGYVYKTSGYYGTFAKASYSWTVNGDSQSTISDMVTTRSAIAVGAYNSKTSFVNVSGSTQTYTGYVRGNIASFSSKGPTADGRTKPNITGPGMALASSVSTVDSSYRVGGDSYSSVVSEYISPLNGKTYSYGMAAGTSMSSPSVSGIVALMLEVNPTLDPQQVLTVLINSAIADSYTGTLPTNGSNVWGFGKVNAYVAMQSLLGLNGIQHDENATINLLLYPNPNNGQYNISYVGENNETLTVKVVNLGGAQVLSQPWNTKAGENIFRMDLAHLPAGIYMTTVTGNKGSSTVKIVKQ